MLTSFSNKVKSFIFTPNTNDNGVNVSRKRKRPFDDSDEPDGGQVTNVKIKKPKLHNTDSVYQSFLHSGVVQSMSDWVQKKTSKFFWRSDRDKATSLPGNGHSYGANGSSGTGRNGQQVTTHHSFSRVDYPQANRQPYRAATMDESLLRPPIRSESRTVQTDGHTGNTGWKSTKKAGTKNTLFRYRNKHKFTAGDSIRLDDKVRYQQLLQQFTTAPLERPPETTQSADSNITRAVCVPQLHKFYFKSNDSILGSTLSKDLLPSHKTHVQDTQKIKVEPSLKSTPGVVPNGTSAEDSLIHITDISAIPQYPHRQQQQQRRHHHRASITLANEKSNTIDLTDELEEDKSIKKDRIRVKSPVPDYRDSKFLSENWIKDLTTTYSSKARERERQIAEEEIRTKLFDERRQHDEVDLELRIRHQMQIYKKEPAVIEDLPEEEYVIEEEEEEEKEEQLPELTNEIDGVISKALRGGGPGQVLVDKFKIQITRNDIMTLEGLNWLNDEIINFYMNLLMERGESEGKAKVYAFNTFFYPKVMQGGQSAVKRWTRRVDVLAVDYILIPVHLGMHWCLAIINFKQKDIQYYDSMGGNNTQCLNALKKYVCDESLDKKKKEFDMSGWKSTIVKDIPQQMNGSDCGMFACKFAEHITREAPLSFTQEHMPYFRRRMVYEIVKAKLLQ